MDWRGGASRLSLDLFDNWVAEETRKRAGIAVATARVELKRIEEKIAKQFDAVAALERGYERLASMPAYGDMPAVPKPFCMPFYPGVPEAPGIYFAWSDGVCVYVGKSKNLRYRLRCHDIVDDSHLVSFLEMPLHEIHLAELFYIWALKPRLNSQVRESVAAMSADS